MPNQVALVVLRGDAPVQELAIELAERNIRPDRVVTMALDEGLDAAMIGPLPVEADCEYVVFLGDHCLLLEELGPILSSNHLPWLQAYVRDATGRREVGALVIVRAELVEAARARAAGLPVMKALERGLKAIGGQAQARNMRVLSHFFESAAAARPRTCAELESWLAEADGELFPPRWDRGAGGRSRVFGLGLSRTGTKSLTAALHILGIDTIHYPNDARTFDELSRASYDLSVLDVYDGITDITTVPYFAQLDAVFPGSRFVLTTRDRESWLGSAERHWRGRSAFETPLSEGRRVHLELRRLLRAAVYGCYDFDAERFGWVYDLHHRRVREHFKDRPSDLLELDICGGEGWEELCALLDRPLPDQAFPHRGSSRKG